MSHHPSWVAPSSRIHGLRPRSTEQAVLLAWLYEQMKTGRCIGLDDLLPTVRRTARALARHHIIRFEEGRDLANPFLRPGPTIIRMGAQAMQVGKEWSEYIEADRERGEREGAEQDALDAALAVPPTTEGM